VEKIEELPMLHLLKNHSSMMLSKTPTLNSKEKPSPSKEPSLELELKDLDPPIPKDLKEKILEIENPEKEPENLNNKDLENPELMSPEKIPTQSLLEI